MRFSFHALTVLIVFQSTCYETAFGSKQKHMPRSGIWENFASELPSCVAAMDSKHRIVSYNVLSSSLSPPDYFTACEPEHLKPENRLLKILKKLDAEIEKDAVILLQEVSRDWVGKFLVFFQTRSYTFLSDTYGNKKNGYMGVALAFPNGKYELTGAEVVRLSDTRKWPRNPYQPPALLRAVTSLVSPLVSPPLTALGKLGKWVLRRPEPPVDHFDYSRNRFNVIAFVRLKERESGGVLVVGTYHMPCVYWNEKVMAIHAAMAVQYMHKVAGGDPFVLGGDFNIKPGDDCYKMIIQGSLDESSAAFPDAPSWESWRPIMKGGGLRSAYAVANGAEPDFTNFAKIKEQEPFIDTLDYIFLSSGIAVEAVEPLPHRSQVKGPFPNADEPSDHILIAADLRVTAAPSNGCAVGSSASVEENERA
eukprot:jgi/Mesvir1/14965/Mv14631-RA.1